MNDELSKKGRAQLWDALVGNDPDKQTLRFLQWIQSLMPSITIHIGRGGMGPLPGPGITGASSPPTTTNPGGGGGAMSGGGGLGVGVT